MSTLRIATTLGALIALWQTPASAADPGAAAEPRSPVVADGKRFLQDGKELIINGMNYFPAYASSIFPDAWLSDNRYRQEIVEEDLTTMQKLRVNLVSIQSFRGKAVLSAQDCSNLHDFLGRARAHGMLVNLYIGNGFPINRPGDLIMVPKSCALAGDPTLFAYDIAWEPHFGNAKQRSSLQTDWTKWLSDRYGSLTIANTALGGTHDMPSDAELCGESSNTRVAAFRFFLDELVSRSYRQARIAVHGVDSTHLIGARSGYGGNGAQATCGDAPVDLRAGAKYLDFVSPEGYALPPIDRAAHLNWGGFTVAYGDVGKPVFWAEYGTDVDGSCPTCTEQVQTTFLLNIHEMMQRTASNGGADWWFVGVRPQSAADTEKSDFGIIYDYIDLPTSVDNSRIPMRDGELALCVDQRASLGLYEGPSAKGTCPAGTKANGTFIDSPPAGSAGSDKWKTLCSADDNLVFKVTYDDDTKERLDCPAGYQSRGSFKPAGSHQGSGAAAVDAFGRSIRSGWLTLCVKGDIGSLKRVRSNMSGLEFTCPAGSKNGGGFTPQVAPIFRPAAKVLAQTLSGVSGAQRTYSKWITVDRDGAAGEWKMYRDGVQAYAAAASSGQRVGVHTACFGTTSHEVKQCVGNAPFNGSCPAKCLNAELESVEILNSAGKWQLVSAGDSIAVAAAKPVRARLVAGNTGESKWLTIASAGANRGSVFFGCNELVGGSRCRQPIASDTQMFGDIASGEFNISEGARDKTHVVLQMLSSDISWFGEPVSITLVPQ